MLTPDQLRRIMPNLAAARAESLLPHLNAAMAEFGIDTLLRTAAFAAQLAHESGEFRWMEEIWGPTSAQKRYEPQTDLSKRLGNSEAGDGLRFKGRGPPPPGRTQPMRRSVFNSLPACDSGIGLVRKGSERGCSGSRWQSERPLIYDSAVDCIE